MGNEVGKILFTLVGAWFVGSLICPIAAVWIPSSVHASEMTWGEPGKWLAIVVWIVALCVTALLMALMREFKKLMKEESNE